MKDLYRIGLLMEKSIGFNRNVIEGIYAHSQRRKNWIFYDAAPTLEGIEALAQWQVDGVIGHFFDEELLGRVLELDIPQVNTTDSLLGLTGALSDVNHQAVGRMAGEYFLGLGFKNFGYVGNGVLQYSKQRLSGYKEALGSENVVDCCLVAYLPQIASAADSHQVRETMKQWVRQIKKPAAVFCSNDIPARDLADVCLELDVSVPNEVAILGVDNDFVECRLSRPPLSSIEIPAAKVGYAAAEMLADMLGERKLRHEGHFSPDPIRVVERGSTSMNAVIDPHVRVVLEYVDAHLTTVSDVAELVGQVPLSRRNLELRVQSSIGMSLWSMVLYKRVDRARALLGEKDASVGEVSERCGFASVRRFSEAFKKWTGVSPRDFKNNARGVL
ncbi:MAG: XylR family transcriptional regulator [Rubritalea sp.]|uniref:DNA-binding transcriptional regulator n=1 Tax=Rubritalea sp. TaxID=2109375 RepID=UPI003242C8BF